METRFIESLIAIVENGSIAGAARSQGLTPAAINQRVRVLEMEFQTPLFQRAGKTVLPTEECLRLLPHAKELVENASLLRNHMDETGLTVELKIGIISTAMASLVPDTLASLKALAPNITVDIIPGTSTFLYDLLDRGDLDVAVLINPPFNYSKKITGLLLRSESLMFAGSKNQNLSINEALQSQPYIRYGSNSWGGQLADQYLRHHGISPEVFCTIDDMETSARMVASGLGVSLLPNWCGREQVAYDLSWCTIEDTTYNRDIVIMRQQGTGKEKALTVFEKALINTHQKFR
ncbi:hypothetical protein A9Q83_15900 [Alphaproteobacteria bacterium 46_93_T64]|nr:hypothetical protein A9Q83_15900 [Alphaproteobacteria bacterium 46_93_T64]